MFRNLNRNKKILLAVIFALTVVAILLVKLTDIDNFKIMSGYFIILCQIMLLTKDIWYRKK